MKTIIKGFFVVLLSLFVYKYAVLPITIPKLELRNDWSARELEWNSQDIFWFIQVTDLHISKYVHLDIAPSLEQFFSTTLDTIQPAVVLASGDLTDAKDFDGVNSFQVEDEWRTYAQLLYKYNVTKRTVYLDIRGNHDSFDVHHLEHENNLHRSYSAKGTEHPTSYTYTMEHYGNNYSFFALDATMKTGPKKVFNFLGILEDEDFSRLLTQKHELQANKQIFFGHFPSSCILSPPPGFQHLLDGGLVYLSGHLHNLGGLAPQLYTMHRSGTAEFELADFKENRMFRVLAIDNGILTFRDQKLNSWPLVVITNPKSSNFLSPKVEPIQKISQSEEIRILAFSPFGIKSVLVSLDNGVTEEIATNHPNISNLFTLKWSPSRYTDDLRHEIRVNVLDNAGNQQLILQPFQTQFSKIEPEFSFYARFILMTNFTSLLQILWIASILVSTLPIIIARTVPGALRPVFSLTTSDKMAELATFSPFYFLYLSMAAWIGFGPWYVGEILSGHRGIILPWSTIVNGQMLPSFYNYVTSFVHLYFFHTPLFWTLLYKFKWRLEGSRGKFLLAVSNIPVTLVLSSQAVLLVVLYFFPSKLGIFKEICLLIAPMEISMIIAGFVCNGLVSYWINESRK